MKKNYLCYVNTSATTSIPEKGRKFFISPLPFHHLMQHFERSREVQRRDAASVSLQFTKAVSLVCHSLFILHHFMTKEI